MAPKVLVPLATSSEELEAIAIVNVLRRAECDVTIASTEDDVTVVCARKTKIECDALLDNVLDEPFDFVALPGGMPGAQRLGQNKSLMNLLKGRRDGGKWYGAICAAPAIALKPNGLFPEHGTSFPALHNKLGDAKNVQDRVVVDEGAKVITSQGPGTAIDFGLSIAELLVGSQAASTVRKQMLA